MGERVTFTQIYSLEKVIKQRLREYRTMEIESLVDLIRRVSQKQADKMWYLFYNGTTEEFREFVQAVIGEPESKKSNGKDTRLPQLRRKRGGIRRRSL